MAKTILTVDDEESICLFIKELFEPEGYKVITALSGEKALEVLKNKKVDLVLVDYFMPGMNGIELCEKIREDPKLKDLKLAFATVAQYGKDIMPQDLERLNVDYHIKKPFNNEELIKKVKDLLR